MSSDRLDSGEARRDRKEPHTDRRDWAPSKLEAAGSAAKLLGEFQDCGAGRPTVASNSVQTAAAHAAGPLQCPEVPQRAPHRPVTDTCCGSEAKWPFRVGFSAPRKATEDLEILGVGGTVPEHTVPRSRQNKMQRGRKAGFWNPAFPGLRQSLHGSFRCKVAYGLPPSCSGGQMWNRPGPAPYMQIY